MKISCVCPTRFERRNFLPQMVDCFLSQTYGDRELVILDEMTESKPWTPPQDERIQYHALVNTLARFTVGKKRNMVNALTHGEIICHFDDDDFSVSTRLQEQYDLLVSSGKQMVGYHDITYYRVFDRTFWVYRYQGKPQPYATGTSQMYYKSVWESNPFKSKVVGEDSDFSFDIERKKQLISVDGTQKIVALSHGQNTFAPQFGSAPFLKADRSEFPVEFLRTVGL